MEGHKKWKQTARDREYNKIVSIYENIEHEKVDYVMLPRLYPLLSTYKSEEDADRKGWYKALIMFLASKMKPINVYPTNKNFVFSIIELQLNDKELIEALCSKAFTCYV